VQAFTDKQIELVTTFADQAAIAIENVRLFESVEARTRELAKSLEDLRTTQDRLVQTQKLASLGQLTAGIAHEIKNPLNFVNNFSGVSAELIYELQETLGKVKVDANTLAEITELTNTLRDNLDKIVQHGKRAENVQRFGGFVAKYMGDGVLAYFGYPQAHEDDAERAVRAGLELIQAVGGLKSSAPLQTRIGIATGLVVVGDLIGSGAAQEQAIVGETPNLAARLQGIAMPDTVVIAESTRQLLGNLFDLEDLGAKDLKGVSGPVRAWAALRPSSVESRFEALRGGGLTTLVGREEELGLLFRRWSKAKTGAGQVVLLHSTWSLRQR
jgi:class 3 adenylate cyclase